MPESAKKYTGSPKLKPVKPPGEAARPNANARGYTWKWRKVREVVLANNPLCVKCEERGDTEEATTIDHIEPHRGDWVKFWEPSNWQALCSRCHNSKTGKGQ